jgi:hypothetical protein
MEDESNLLKQNIINKPDGSEEKENLCREGKEKRGLFLGLVTGALGFFAVSSLGNNKAYADAVDAPILTSINANLVTTSASIASVAASVKQQIDNFNQYVKPFTDSYTAIKSVFDSWNNLINEVNLVMDAVQKSRDFLQNLLTNNNFLYKQAQQIYAYVSNLTNGNSDWAKIRLNNIDFYSQALVMRYQQISSKFDAMRSAWGTAGKHSNSAPHKLFIYTANQQVENSYYEYRSHAYKREFEEIQKKVSDDDLLGKLPQGKTQSEMVNEVSKNMVPQLLADQLNVQTQTLKVMTLMLQHMSGITEVLPEEQKMPGSADFANAFSKAKNGETYSPLKN